MVIALKYGLISKDPYETTIPDFTMVDGSNLAAQDPSKDVIKPPVARVRQVSMKIALPGRLFDDRGRPRAEDEPSGGLTAVFKCSIIQALLPF